MKFSVGVLDVRVALLFTTKVTGNVSGPLPAPGDDTVTVSLYVPGPMEERIAGFSASDKAWGVVPTTGLTMRKLGPPLDAAALELNVRAEPELEICTFCAAGIALLPSW